MGYIPLILVIVWLVLGWGKIIKGIIDMFKPIKDEEGKTIIWKNGKKTVHKGYDEVDKVLKNMSKKDRMRNLKKNLRRLEMKKKGELEEEKRQKREKLNEDLKNFRMKKNEEEQNIKNEETQMENLISYLRCETNLYPNVDDPIKGVVDTFKKIFIKGIENDQDINNVVSEVTEFYKYIKKDFTFKYEDMIRVRDLIERIQILPYENHSSTESGKVKRPLIPQRVKDKVWNRDGGKCVQCGSNKNIEFDHIIPFSKGGSSTYRNLQILCEKCNRTKSNKIG